ncbi:MAG: rod shape-determining protein RodA [Syntrophales bacterium]|jgi:rod shape determining protein RodA|nr:rod shape-determining protein RodA [Syntrophales bacterium]MCU0554034.1 rod shape-determining protein RodA [Syntrophales bacterium]
MKIDRRLIFNFDWTLMTLITVIVGMGVLNLYSAGYGISGEPYFKQMRWVLLGMGVMALAFAFDYRWIARYAYAIHALAVVLLIAVFAVGSVTKGSQRWINLGGFTMQPSELVKITLIFALAKYFNDHRMESKVGIRELVVPFLIVLVPFVLVLKQPDLGTALMLMILFGSMVLFIGIRWRTLLGLASLVLLVIPLGWNFLAEYQKERVLTFIDPERDPLGSGYHIIQSIIAVGSGGILGKGFMKGTQSQLKFLPEQQTDFVFSVFAEEWGFLGALLVLVLFLALILWGLKIAQHSRDYLGTLVAFGVTMLIFWGVFINVAMVLGILPVVGIPLPFFSYGGSSMVKMMAAMGFLMNVSMRRYVLQS